MENSKTTGNTQGDFNGNGGVSASDVSILSANFYANLQVLLVCADLDGDFAVTSTDLNLIADNIGLTDATREDGDGDVTLADLDLAFAQYGLAGLMLSVA